MARTNEIFKGIVNELTTVHLMDKDEALTVAKKAISENRKKHHHHGGAGGQSGHTKPITIADDACEGVNPTCDGSSTYRTIDGTCNNIQRPYWGAMSTPFAREIAVDEYNPKTDTTFFDDDGVTVDGGSYTREMSRKGI